MTTNIIKSSDLGFLISDHNQAFSGDLREKVIARLRDQTLMPDQ
jgi:hypothetical protein